MGGELLMSNVDKRRVIARNAGVWVIAMLASFILPLIVDSVTQKGDRFFGVLAQMGPLLASLLVSTALLDKAMDKPAER
jgi:hypothetical protein